MDAEIVDRDLELGAAASAASAGAGAGSTRSGSVHVNVHGAFSAPVGGAGRRVVGDREGHASSLPRGPVTIHLASVRREDVADAALLEDMRAFCEDAAALLAIGDRDCDAYGAAGRGPPPPSHSASVRVDVALGVAAIPATLAGQETTLAATRAAFAKAFDVAGEDLASDWIAKAGTPLGGVALVYVAIAGTGAGGGRVGLAVPAEDDAGAERTRLARALLALALYGPAALRERAADAAWWRAREWVLEGCAALLACRRQPAYQWERMEAEAHDLLRQRSASDPELELEGDREGAARLVRALCKGSAQWARATDVPFGTAAATLLAALIERDTALGLRRACPFFRDEDLKEELEEGRGSRRYSPESMAADWSRQCAPRRNFLASVAFMFRLVLTQQPLLFAIMCLGSCTMHVARALLNWMVDALAFAGKPDGGGGGPSSARTLAFLAATAFMYPVGRFVVLITWHQIVTRVSSSTYLRLMKHLNSLPAVYFTTFSDGFTLGLFATDMQRLEVGIMNGLGIFMCMIGATVSLSMSFYINVPITAVVLSVQVAVIVGESLSGIMSKSEQFSDEKQTKLGEMTSHVHECIVGQATIRDFRHAPVVNAAFAELAEGYRRVAQSAYVYGECMLDIIVDANIALQAGILATGVLLVPRGVLTAGEVLTVLNLAWTCQDIVAELCFYIPELINVSASVSHLRRFLEFSEEERMPGESARRTPLDPSGAKGWRDVCAACVGSLRGRTKAVLPAPSKAARAGEDRVKLKSGDVAAAKGDPEGRVPSTAAGGSGVSSALDVRVEGAWLKYHPALDNYVLKGLSLIIPGGMKVSIVGPSGGGKSSLLAVLCRTLPLLYGAVFAGGEGAADVPLERWRRKLCLVSQSPHIFKNTVAANIRVGNSRATDEQVVEAARAVQLHQAILNMPQAYATVVSGPQLSGGQRQRVALARALVADPAVLLLDEVTSSLDAATERAINETIRTVSRGRTVLEVTHRLAGCEHADLVVVLDKGRVVETGSHAELLARRGGLYRRLYRISRTTAEAEEAHVSVGQLRSLPLFDEHAAGLPDADFGPLLAVAGLVWAEGGSAVAEEGAACGTVFFLLSGRAARRRRVAPPASPRHAPPPPPPVPDTAAGGGGPPTASLPLEPGDAFNFEAILAAADGPSAPLSHTLAAEDRCQLVALPAAALRPWLEAHAPTALGHLRAKRAVGRWGTLGRSSSRPGTPSSSSPSVAT